MSQPRIEIVQLDPFETDYREKVSRLIDRAEYELIAIVGEIGAYRYVDVRWSIERAIDRRCRVQIYADESKADLHVIGRLIDLGAELYLGPECPDRSMVVDRRHWFGRPADKRAGEVHWDDPDGAAKIVEKFEECKSNGKQVFTVDTGKEPFFEVFSNVTA